MKKIITTIVCILGILEGFAQSELSMSGGVSLPAGDFASNSGGAAKTGFLGDILYQHQMGNNSKLWLAGMMRFHSHKVDLSQFESAFPDMKITSSNWEVFSFLLGPVVRIDLQGETSVFEPRILLGYMNAKSPNVSVSSSSASLTVESDEAGAFAVLLGASFKFKVAPKISVGTSIDYLSADPKFDLTATSGTLSESEESQQQINSFNVTAGLTFILK